MQTQENFHEPLALRGCFLLEKQYDIPLYLSQKQVEWINHSTSMSQRCDGTFFDGFFWSFLAVFSGFQIFSRHKKQPRNLVLSAAPQASLHQDVNLLGGLDLVNTCHESFLLFFASYFCCCASFGLWSCFYILWRQKFILMMMVVVVVMMMKMKQKKN